MSDQHLDASERTRAVGQCESLFLAQVTGAKDAAAAGEYSQNFFGCRNQFSPVIQYGDAAGKRLMAPMIEGGACRHPHLLSSHGKSQAHRRGIQPAHSFVQHQAAEHPDPRYKA